MPIVKRTALKDFNPTGLLESLAALPLTGLGFDGFDKVTGRHVIPAGAPKVVATSAGVPTDTAGVGEVRLHVSRALTAQEDTDLDAALAAHDQAVLTGEQGREDQDEADIDNILATEEQEFKDVLNRLQVVVAGWDAANTNQRQAATKASIDDIRVSLKTLGKIMRNFLREQRPGAEI